MTDAKNTPAKKKSAVTSEDSQHTDSGKSDGFILTHRPILKDPALKERSFAESIPNGDGGRNSSSEGKGGGTGRETTIKPLMDTDNSKDEPAQDDKTAEKADDRESEKPVDEKESDQAVEATKETPKPEPEKTDGESKNPADLTSEEIDNAEAEKQAKHDAEIEKLVNEKRYFLPINAVEKRRTKRFVILGIVLSLLLALAWVDVALDAGLIQIPGVKPFTHFFSN